MIFLTESSGKNILATRLSEWKYTYILTKNKLEVGTQGIVWEELEERGRNKHCLWNYPTINKKEILKNQLEHNLKNSFVYLLKSQIPQTESVTTVLLRHTTGNVHQANKGKMLIKCLCWPIQKIQSREKSLKHCRPERRQHVWTWLWVCHLLPRVFWFLIVNFCLWSWRQSVCSHPPFTFQRTTSLCAEVFSQKALRWA